MTATERTNADYGGLQPVRKRPGSLRPRYLYVLMCLTCDLTYLNTQFNDLSGATTARYIAQWAINAVDFKARDSIMTPFDYDPSFAVPGGTVSGWNPQGVTSGGTCTVWGCKRPDLLISETLAFHDRRTQDTNTEVVARPKDDRPMTRQTTTGPGYHRSQSRK